MAKDFKKHFTKDLGKAITKGRKEVAKTVARSLIEKGPWWTGTFGENWIVSKNPVQPTRKRKRTGFPFPEGPTTREIKTPKVPNVTLKQDLYIGNRAKYAGFAINAPGQKLSSFRGGSVTYSEHFKESKFPTAMAGNWYVIYTKGGFINKDIAMAFKKVGFK